MNQPVSISRWTLICLMLLALAQTPATATVLLFENLALPMARELDGLQSVQDYGDHVSSAHTGGFKNSFAKGNGCTPNITLDYSAGNARKTVS